MCTRSLWSVRLKLSVIIASPQVIWLRLISGVVCQTLDAVCFFMWQVRPEEEQDCVIFCLRVLPEVAQWATAPPADAESWPEAPWWALLWVFPASVMEERCAVVRLSVNKLYVLSSCVKGWQTTGNCYDWTSKFNFTHQTQPQNHIPFICVHFALQAPPERVKDWINANK